MIFLILAGPCEADSAPCQDIDFSEQSAEQYQTESLESSTLSEGDLEDLGFYRPHMTAAKQGNNSNSEEKNSVVKRKRVSVTQADVLF